MALKTKEPKQEANPAAVALARMRWDKATAQEKSDNARRASLVAAQKRKKAIGEFVCSCGAGEAMEGHKSTCLRGRAIKRRNSYATAPNTPIEAQADGSEGQQA